MFWCSFGIISTKELITIIKNKKALIIDVRPVDEYNGWSLQDEARGGHIKGGKLNEVKICDNLVDNRYNCGAFGIRVEKREELEDAMQKIKDHDGPALLDIVCDVSLI